MARSSLFRPRRFISRARLSRLACAVSARSGASAAARSAATVRSLLRSPAGRASLAQALRSWRRNEAARAVRRLRSCGGPALGCFDVAVLEVLRGSAPPACSRVGDALRVAALEPLVASVLRARGLCWFRLASVDAGRLARLLVLERRSPAVRELRRGLALALRWQRVLERPASCLVLLARARRLGVRP